MPTASLPGDDCDTNRSIFICMGLWCREDNATGSSFGPSMSVPPRYGPDVSEIAWSKPCVSWSSSSLSVPPSFLTTSLTLLSRRRRTTPSSIARCLLLLSARLTTCRAVGPPHDAQARWRTRCTVPGRSDPGTRRARTRSSCGSIRFTGTLTRRSTGCTRGSACSKGWPRR